jgi:hypothetical protein
MDIMIRIENGCSNEKLTSEILKTLETSMIPEKIGMLLIVLLSQNSVTRWKYGSLKINNFEELNIFFKNILQSYCID